MGVLHHHVHDIGDLSIVKDREIGMKAMREGLMILHLISLDKKDRADPSTFTGRDRSVKRVSYNKSFVGGYIREFGEDMSNELRVGHSNSTDIEGCQEQVKNLCDLNTGLLLYHHPMLDGHAGIRDCDNS